MTELTRDAFRTIAPSDAIPNQFVVPYYLDERKLRISVARVDDRFYAFDDLCTCTDAACPLSGRPADGDDDHVPMPWLPVLHHHRSRDQRPGHRGSQRVRGERGRRQHSDSSLTGALTAELRLAVGFTMSAAGEIARKALRARVVKAFNTVFAQNMSTGKVKGEQLTLLVAGDDDAAKKTVLAMGSDIGFDPVDAGPLMNARWLEALAYLNIQLGFVLKMGPEIGVRLVH